MRDQGSLERRLPPGLGQGEPRESLKLLSVPAGKEGVRNKRKGHVGGPGAWSPWPTLEGGE